MKPLQIVAGACIAFVAVTLVALATRGYIMPLFKPGNSAEGMLYFSVFQAIAAVIAAGLAWIVALMVKRAVVARVTAFVLCGYVLGVFFIYINDRLSEAMSGKLGAIPSRLVLPILIVVISLVAIARSKPARRA